MDDECCDVAIVGGGPAGAAAAFALARAGRHVVVFERAAMPRDKVCGDLLGTDAIAQLHAIGFTQDVIAAGHGLDGAVLHGPGGERFGAVASAPARDGVAAPRAFVVRRQTFDAALLGSARTAGASVRFEAAIDLARDTAGRIVGVRTAANSVRARATILADGWSSLALRELGTARRDDRNVAVATRAYARGVRGLGARMHFFINPRGNGYGWIFPLGNGEANAGLGYLRAEETIDLPSAWARFVGAGSFAAPFLREAWVASPRTWPIPIGPSRGPVSAPGLFVAGDAATLASPISGSGIASALASGAAAATFARRALDGDEGAWHAYGAWVRRHVVRRLKIEAFAHAAFGTPGAFARVSPLMRFPGVDARLSHALLALG